MPTLGKSKIIEFLCIYDLNFKGAKVLVQNGEGGRYLALSIGFL